MKAPSEKHLEDYLWAHPEAFDEFGVDEHNNPIPHFIPRWRQIPVASGIVDIVGSWFGLGLAVVEIKKGTIDTKAFAQIMRYKRDFRNMVQYLICTYGSNGAALREHMPMDHRITEWWKSELIQGILVGESIPDKNLLIACQACDIEVYTYQYDGAAYILNRELDAIQDDTFPGWTQQTPAPMIRFLMYCIRTQLEFIGDDKINSEPFDVIKLAEWHLEVSESKKS